MSDGKIVVVGAGVVGLSVAWKLVTEGWEVVVVGAGDCFRAESWLGSGALACRSQVDVPALWPLGAESAAMYGEWISLLSEASGLPLAYAEVGTLLAASSAAEESALREHHEALNASGCGGEMLSGARARRIEPMLSEKVSAALHFESEGRVDSDKLRAALLAGLARSGVEVLEAEVGALLHSAGRVSGVVVDGEELACGWVVDARVFRSKALGPADELPLERAAEQILGLRRRSGGPRRILCSRNTRVVSFPDGTSFVRSMVKGVRVASTLGAQAAAALLDGALSLVPDLGGAECIGQRSRALQLTDDGLPVIGEVENDPGHVVAVGHGCSALLLAPLSARVVAEIVAGQSRAALAALSPQRFGDHCV